MVILYFPAEKKLYFCWQRSEAIPSQKPEEKECFCVSSDTATFYIQNTSLAIHFDYNRPTVPRWKHTSKQEH